MFTRVVTEFQRDALLVIVFLHREREDLRPIFFCDLPDTAEHSLMFDVVPVSKGRLTIPGDKFRGMQIRKPFLLFQGIPLPLHLNDPLRGNNHAGCIRNGLIRIGAAIVEIDCKWHYVTLGPAQPLSAHQHVADRESEIRFRWHTRIPSRAKMKNAQAGILEWLNARNLRPRTSRAISASSQTSC